MGFPAPETPYIDRTVLSQVLNCTFFAPKGVLPDGEGYSTIVSVRSYVPNHCIFRSDDVLRFQRSFDGGLVYSMEAYVADLPTYIRSPSPRALLVAYRAFY